MAMPSPVPWMPLAVVLLPLKWLENMFRKFRTHADARILDAKLIGTVSVGRVGLLPDGHGHRAARRRKLNGI